MKAAYLCLILVLLLLCAGYHANATDVGGIIDADTTWTLDNSPYIVVGNILVNEGVTLTIEPGVTVKFDRHPEFGNLYLYVDGTLIARGTESNIITFTSNQENPTIGHWKCIKFRDSAVDATFDVDGNYVSGCILEYCKVEYGGNVRDTEGTVWCDYAAPFISYSTVTLNDSSGIYIRESSQGVRVSNCNVSDNIGCGIYLEQSLGSIISGCTVSDNLLDSHENKAGIYLLNSPESNVSDCTVSGNGVGGANKSGIHLLNSPDSRVDNCAVSNNSAEYGIWISGSSNSVVSNCNGNDGVRIEQSSGSNINTCTLEFDSEGIYITDSPDINIANCTLSGHNGISIGNSSNCAISNCNISGTSRTGIRIYSSDNSTVNDCVVISGNAGHDGIIANDFSNFSINNCTVRGISGNYGTGIGLGSISDSTINNCVVSNYNTGIHISRSDSSRIVNSFVTENDYYGIYYTENALNQTIRCCEVYNNTRYDVNLFYINAGDVIATNNWWGTTDTDVIDEHIWDFWDGNFDSGKVIYEPFLESPVGESCPKSGLLAAIIHVPGDQPTIQKGINAASDGDTVLVADGIYTGGGNKNLDFGGKAITVTSENGAESCIIDCEGNGRGFYFHSGETGESVVNGFTIKNGHEVQGGGGICCEDSSPTIQNNTISGNSTDGSGGGIYCYNSDSIITNNKLTENWAGISGGGIKCLKHSPMITYNTITLNSAGGWGGGIYCDHSSATITNNTIIENSTEGVPGEGGGIFCDYSFPTITNNTITRNSANYGGGIHCYLNSSPIITNTICWNDSPEEIYLDGSSITVTYSDIQGGWEGEGNIDADPLFVDPDNDDYHLQAGSPCVDAGDPNSPKDPDGTRADIGAFYYEQSVIPVPTTFEKVSGDNQSGNVSSTLPNPLVVRVLDQNSKPLYGVAVNFEVSKGASVKPTQATTNEDGEAQTILTLGMQPGEYNVTASVKGKDPVVFAATASCEPCEPCHVLVITNTLVITGTVYRQTQEVAEDGLHVEVNIITQRRTSTDTTGKTVGKGQYSVTFFDMQKTVAKAGDEILITVKDASGKLVGQSRHTLTAAEVEAKETRIDVTPTKAIDVKTATVTLTLHKGINVISLPVKAEEGLRMSDLAERIGKDNLAMIIRYDYTQDKFISYLPTFPDASKANATVKADEGYIVVMKADQEVEFEAKSSDNENASPSLMPVMLSDTQSTSIFVVTGNVRREDTGEALNEVAVTIRNLRTGQTVYDVTGSLAGLGNYVATFVAPQEEFLMRTGDKFSITAQDASHRLTIAPIIHTLTPDDITDFPLIIPLRLSLPKQSVLLQNYPNPFNPETWIPFKLAQNALVTIHLYSTKGQLIRTIVLGNQTAGIYTTKDRAAYWDGRDNLGEKVSSGVYYYTLQAGEFRATQKMVVVK